MRVSNFPVQATRGTHGCQAYVLVSGSLCRHPRTPREYRVSGRVTQIQCCPSCDAYANLTVDDVVTFDGWIDPTYYGVEGLVQ